MWYNEHIEIVSTICERLCGEASEWIQGKKIANMETVSEWTEKGMVQIANSQCIGVVVQKCVEYFHEPSGT